MILKLRKKFIFINMILISLVFIIFFFTLGISTYQSHKKETLQALKRTLEMDTMKPHFQIVEPNKPRTPHLNIPVLLAYLISDDFDVEILHTNMTISNEVVELAIEEAINSNESSGIIKSLNLRFLIDDSHPITKIAFADMSLELSALRHLIFILMGIGVSGLLIFFLISLYLAVWALRPVERSWEQQQQFVADASHELKTPLTIILANMNILLNQSDDTDKSHQKWLKNTQAEALRMKSLVDDLLYLAKSEAHHIELKLFKLNLSDLTWNCILQFESRAYENGIVIYSNIQSDLWILGDENSLRQLIAILLDNACKYTPINNKITVSLSRHKNRIQCEVNNTGELIPEDQLPNLFSRFYRVDEARKHQEGSYGLGLAIAQSIAKKHQAKITVESTLEAGTTFKVSFPAY